MEEKRYCVECVKAPGLGYYITTKDQNDAENKVAQAVGEKFGSSIR